MPLTKATQAVIAPNICTTDTAQTITGIKTFGNIGATGVITGNLTGNVTGNLTGNVTGDLTGNVTGNVTATSVSTTNLVNGSSLCFRNKIINGNFGINQRGYVSGTATSGANQYTLDRWRVVTSGQNLTFSASGTGNIVTAPAGGIEQVIESLNIEGGTYTLSWTGTATGAVNGSAVSNGGQVTLPANTNATIKFSSGTVSLVQLEEGSVATPFENLPIGTELDLCQRYYEFVGTQISFISFSDAAVRNFGTNISYRTQKRIAPLINAQTIIYGNASGATFSLIQPYNFRLTWLSGGVVGQTSIQIDGLTASAEF